MEFQLGQHRPENAAELAVTIHDHRRGIALAKTAAAFARLGQTKRSSGLIAQAEAHMEFAHPWQGEAVRAEVAIAHAAGDRMHVAASVVDGLKDEAARIRARSGIALEQARRGEPYEKTAFEFPVAPQPAPERLPAVRALLEIGALQPAAAGGSEEEKAVAVLAQSIETILAGSRVTAGEEYLDLALLWRRVNNAAKSAEMVGRALRHMPPGIELQDWREGYFARLVGTYLDGGDHVAVEKMLSTARVGIAPLHRFYQPPALCQLAEAQLIAGQAEEAEKTWLEAARVARTNPNPSSQYLGCAQVAFSIARADRALSAEMGELLAAQLGGAKGSDSLAGH